MTVERPTGVVVKLQQPETARGCDSGNETGGAAEAILFVRTARCHSLAGHYYAAQPSDPGPDPQTPLSLLVLRRPQHHCPAKAVPIAITK